MERSLLSGAYGFDDTDGNLKRIPGWIKKMCTACINRIDDEGACTREEETKLDEKEIWVEEDKARATWCHLFKWILHALLQLLAIFKLRMFSAELSLFNVCLNFESGHLPIFTYGKYGCLNPGLFWEVADASSIFFLNMRNFRLFILIL